MSDRGDHGGELQAGGHIIVGVTGQATRSFAAVRPTVTRSRSGADAAAALAGGPAA